MSQDYVVIEFCEDLEQILALYTDKDLPPGGILVWAEGRLKRTVFPDRKSARAAIERTHHYAKAFGRDDLPDRSSCKIEPVVYCGDKP